MAPPLIYKAYTSGLKRELFRTLSGNFKSTPTPSNYEQCAVTKEPLHAQKLIPLIADRASGYSSRARLVKEIIPELSFLSAESVLELWDGANDLIAPEIPSSTRAYGLDLLHACIERLLPVMSETLRLAFFYNIMDNCGVADEKAGKAEKELHKVIKSLDALTCHGTRLESILRADESTCGLEDFFESIFASISVGGEPKPPHQTVVSALRFAESCARHGVPITDELISCVVTISRGWDENEVRKGALDLLKAAFSERPVESKELSRSVLQALLTIYHENNELSDSVTETLHLALSGQNGTQLLPLFLDMGFFDGGNTDVSYISLLVSLLTVDNVEGLWQKCGSSPRHIAELLLRLLRQEFNKHSSSNISASQLFGNILCLLESEEFLRWISKFRGFWLVSEEEPSIQDLLTPFLQKVELDDLDVKYLRMIFNQILNISQSGNYKLFGINEFKDIFEFLFAYSRHLNDSLANQLLDLLDQSTSDAVLVDGLVHDIITRVYLADFGTNVRCRTLEVIEKCCYEIISKRKQWDSSLCRSLKHLFSMLETEKDNTVALKQIEIYCETCRYLPSGFIAAVNSEVFGQAFTKPSSRRRSSLIPLSLGSSPAPAWSEVKLIKLTEGLAGLLVWCIAFERGDCFGSFYRLLTKAAQYAYQTAQSELFLASARVLSKVYCGNSRQVVFQETNDVEGITIALNKNSRAASTLENNGWSYPETIIYFNEAQSKVLKCDAYSPELVKDDFVTPGAVDIRTWISTAIDMIGNPTTWEVYSYLLTFMCPQFANLVALRSIDDLVGLYRDVICRHMKSGLPSKLKIPSGLCTDNLHAVYVRSLSPLLAYHSYLPKDFTDGIVESLLYGLHTKDSTLTLSLHLLTICCQEIPGSVKKLLTPILVQLQTRVTSSMCTPAILEFLLALSNSPFITSHLTADEFKRVFAIAFKFIQSSRDLKERAQTQNIIQQISYLEQAADSSPSTHSFKITASVAHFFLTLSYKVISSWFLRMKLSNRVELAPFVVKCLVSSASEAESKDYDVSAHIDIISHLTATPHGPSFPHRINEDRANESNDGYDFGRWILSDKIVSIETDIQTGDSVITMRSPSSSEVFKLQFERSQIPKPYDIFRIGQEEEEEPSTEKFEQFKFTASFVLTQLGCVGRHPVKVPDDSSIARSVHLFDKTPVSEYHKIGLIYVGPQQDSEAEVLSNTNGSYQYKLFLSRLGHLVKLKDCMNVYTGGLEPDVDGEFALVYNAEKTQAVFHAATLMPNNPQDDQYSMKKRHIGNNFVTIFFDESGSASFDFNIIKSQFNFINIVIKPYQATDTGKGSKHFKVRMYRKAGVPAFFSTSHFKILSAENLAKYVRHVSLIADTFSTCWFSASAPEVCTTWARRAKQMSSIREKTLKWYEGHGEPVSPPDFASVVEAAGGL
ncbi:KLTH0B02024p [Lachancea thermotolerans CBS 6340]|uniref:KLTH0B02024p n=1 Tax=Lachancea thermotolerans (strain ATCC 56472 / CBS 6340 / NRRL Y-8284) TaxID=559295 RepID=C5DCD0_LACTC|nr:KLTH0B02024p [Lachancea thermotolerans CBS 6340]CAR21441.1 KLTH0B02024p [Lachancea thermotolerans CBS 6340]